MSEKQKAIAELFRKLNVGLESYHDDVDAMSDKELWDHVFDGEELKEDDYCVQQLKWRFLYKSGMTNEGANQFLLDTGYTQQEIDDLEESISQRVMAKIKEINDKYFL